MEAIFLCYLVDQEENDGDTRAYYASAALRAYMEQHRPCYQLPEQRPVETESSADNTAPDDPEGGESGGNDDES